MGKSSWEKCKRSSRTESEVPVESGKDECRHCDGLRGWEEEDCGGEPEAG